MLTHPTLALLGELGLYGMARGFQDLQDQPEARSLEHGDWLALLLEREATMRSQKRFEARARAARLRHDAVIEDADFRAKRGLDRGLFLQLAGCDFIRKRQGLLLTGPAGVGKSWLACALGQKACREDFSVAYHRAPRLFATLALARGDGRYARLLKTLARVDLLILDDWGPERLDDDQRRDLLEIVEDRYERRSTIVTSQIPVGNYWKSHHRRRRARPPRPQRLSHRTHGREPEKKSAPTGPRHRLGLTRKRPSNHHPQRPRITPRSGRLQIGMLAGMKSEYLDGD